MKKLVNLKGVKALNKAEQQSIFGGGGFDCKVCKTTSDCGTGGPFNQLGICDKTTGCCIYPY